MRTSAALSFPGLKAKACRTPGQAWENEQTDWGGLGVLQRALRSGAHKQVAS